MSREFIALNIAVLTISDTRTLAEDTSGQALVERLSSAGHQLADRKIVRDDIYAIRAQVSQWIADDTTDVIITTGGTGITGRDGTPEAIQPLLDKTIEGFGELFRDSHIILDEGTNVSFKLMKNSKDASKFLADEIEVRRLAWRYLKIDSYVMNNVD